MKPFQEKSGKLFNGLSISSGLDLISSTTGIISNARFF
jgi:hypothetical protein